MSETLPNKAPHFWWTLSEPRALFDLAAFYTSRSRLKRLPKGDGHPVMVVPGFLSGDGATAPLRRLLKDLGYRTYGWGQGQNTEVSADIIEKLSWRLVKIHMKSGQKISLIGWSLGGIIVRELAKLHPNLVRDVITLGSPVSGQFNHTPAYKIYVGMNGAPSEEDKAFYETIKVPPPVPSTSIYSRSDGVVAWRHSLQPEGPLTENIKIGAGHFGLAVNPDAIKIIADRLAQPEGEWQKYTPKPRRSKATRKAEKDAA